MELSNEQRELISAYLDGEVNASERALAQALLQRTEGASYFASLKRVRELAQSHGAARAPQNFAALVRQSLEGDFDSISRPTSNSGDYDSISRPTSNQAPIHSLPQATWRTPLLAAAAAIVMALSIFAYNAIVLPSAAPSEVAKLHAPSPADPVINESPDLALKSDKHLDDHNEEAGPAQDAEALKKAEAARRNSDEVERANRKKNPEDAADNLENKKAEGYEGDGDVKGGKTKDDNKNSTPEKSDNWRGGTDGAGTGGGSGSAGGERKDLEGKEPRTSRARQNGEAKPAESAPPPKAPSPENRPAENGPAKESAKAKEAREEITIDVSGTRAADSPSLTTDMLQVASVYGEATASSDETGATIEVEVTEDQLAEMVAALNKLAKEAKEKGSTRREAEDPQADDQSKDEPARARDYLPKDKREAPEGAAETEKAEKPGTAAPPQSTQGKKKVRIIVRLK